MRRNRIVSACAVVCAAAGLAAGVASSKGQTAPQRVTVFGDSQIAAVAMTPDARAMLAKGVDLDLRASVCRRLVQQSCPYQGTRPSTVLEEVRDTETGLGATVVILVGYNDFESSWADDVTAVMRALVTRKVTSVLWLPLTELRPNWGRMNDSLRGAARAWPQLEVLDWKDTADPSWFRDDDIHLTLQGAIGLASYVHFALIVRGIALPAPSAPARVSLRITIRGAGAVTAGGVRCRASCSRLLPAATIVRLRALPPVGSAFVRWGGACSGTSPSCVLQLARNTAVVARFRPR